MADNSAIEWTDSTWNPVRGCDKVSAGCKNCYAETFAERWRGIKGHPFEQGFDLRLVPEALDKPLRWKKPRKIFVNSMSDLFHEKIPNEYIAAVFGVMAACPQHTFQVLTKRAARMREWFENPPDIQAAACAALDAIGFERGCGSAFEADEWPLRNVHLGVSAENQETADERIPLLLQCPAAVRWVSAEPLLGPIDGNRFIRPMKFVNGYRQASAGITGVVPSHLGAPGIDWAVVGGESGPGARACDIAWIRSIVEQCKAADVPAFLKQLGARPLARSRWDMSDEQFRINDAAGWTENDGPILLRLSKRKGGDIAEFPEDLRVRQFPRSAP